MKFRLRPEFVLWTTASLMLVLSTDFYWMESSARIISSPQRCLLSAGQAWQMPLAVWNSDDTFAAWPFYAFAICAATLIGSVVSRAVGSSFGLWAAVLLTGLSLSIQPDQLISGVLIVATCRLLARQATTAVQFACTSVMLIGAAIAMSLEFGLVLLLVAMTASQFAMQRTTNDQLQTRRHVFVCAVSLIAIAIACTFDGFAAATLRPLSWLWRPTDLIPSIKFAGSEINTIAVVLTGLPILKMVWQALKSESAKGGQKLLCLVLGMIGLGCGYYTVLAAIALSELSDQELTPSLTQQNRRNLWIPCSCLVAASMYWAWLLADNGMSAMGGTSQPRMVDPTQWRFDGPVLLTNRDHAADWQSKTCRDRFPLLMDNRWDTESDELPEYTAAVYDIFQGLREFHLKSDTVHGGYRLFLDRHHPAAIVVDSSRLDTIRHLSVDPIWRVMSIDSRRTIFGSTKSEKTRSQTIRASELFFQLEWPRPNVSMQLDGILALGTAADSRVVASVLIAMRLPYAALRVLPEDRSTDTETVRAWAYAELAHRAVRHTGQPSLLDHFRATSALRTLNNSLLQSPSGHEKIRRTLESLNSSDLRTASVDLNLTPTEPEYVARQALVDGDPAAAMQAAKLIQIPAVVTFYEELASSHTKPVSKTLKRLLAVMNTNDLPPHIYEEALFYCGCLELELGNADMAGNFFSQSQQINPMSRFQAIRRLYLSQMSPK
jgi:hypothetical protein